MFSIAPYRVVVLGPQGTTINLWGNNKQAGLATWFHGELSSQLGVVREHSETRRSRIARVARNASGDLVCGVLQTGMNGYASDLVNTDTGSVSHHRTVIEAEFVPFFFMLVSPIGSDFALLLLQRFGNLGVRDFFVEPLVKQFDAKSGAEKRRLRITRLVPADLAQQLLDESIVKSIRLIRYEEPGEISDALGDGFSERTGAVEMRFTAKRDGGLPTPPGFVQALLGKKPVNQVFSMENFEYDTIKVELDAGGHRRVVDLARPNVLTPNIDVTDELQTAGGHPTWESVLTCFAEFAVGALQQEKISWTADVALSHDESAEPLPELVLEVEQ